MNISHIINDLYIFNFVTNTFADKKHENVVKSILLQNGLVQIEKDDSKFSAILKDRKNNLTTIEELKDCFLFIEQPFGSQKSPDFIICVAGFILWIECKSGKKLVWNTGYPKTNLLIVFSSKLVDKTILFFGQFSKLIEKNPKFEEQYEALDKILKKYCKEEFEELFGTDTGFDLYHRRMLNDKTKYEKDRDSLFERTKNLLGI